MSYMTSIYNSLSSSYGIVMCWYDIIISGYMSLCDHAVYYNFKKRSILWEYVIFLSKYGIYRLISFYKYRL